MARVPGIQPPRQPGRRAVVDRFPDVLERPSAAPRSLRSGSRRRSADLPRSRPRRSDGRPCRAPGRSRPAVARTVSSVESLRRIAIRRIGPEVATATRVGMPSRAIGPASARKLAWSDLWRFSAHHEIVRGICWNSSSPQRSASSTAARCCGSAGNSGGSALQHVELAGDVPRALHLAPVDLQRRHAVARKTGRPHQAAADDRRQVHAAGRGCPCARASPRAAAAGCEPGIE